MRLLRLIMLSCLFAFTCNAIPIYHSNPSAPVKLFIEFNAVPPQSWWASSIPATPAYDTDGNPASFSSAELANITQISLRVAEKFSPFNIDVTTEDPDPINHINYNNFESMRVVVGGDGAWTGGSGTGISKMYAFRDITPNTAYVFSVKMGGDPHQTAEIVAHEAGHMLSLTHHSVFIAGKLSNEYDPGDGIVAPLMGNSLYSVRGLWANTSSDFGGIDTPQEDIGVISAPNNHIGLRAEDHGQDFAHADGMTLTGTTATTSGIIITTGDQDTFFFNTNGGTVDVSMNVVQFGPMLHGKLELFDSNGNLISSSATSALDQSITTDLLAGKYYVKAESFGSYGDVGQYTLTVQGAAVPEPSALILMALAILSFQMRPHCFGPKKRRIAVCN